MSQWGVAPRVGISKETDVTAAIQHHITCLRGHLPVACSQREAQRSPYLEIFICVQRYGEWSVLQSCHEFLCSLMSASVTLCVCSSMVTYILFMVVCALVSLTAEQLQSSIAARRIIICLIVSRPFDRKVPPPRLLPQVGR